ncbi:MAG: hypothetical protein JOS17DRAFT_171509 [Linnemannia elongata]|nr:MAG: hypothetical protein JOS17DRAFT_171509 [Linnemannia elongata]
MVPAWGSSFSADCRSLFGENRGTATCEESRLPWTRASLFWPAEREEENGSGNDIFFTSFWREKEKCKHKERERYRQQQKGTPRWVSSEVCSIPSSFFFSSFVVLQSCIWSVFGSCLPFSLMSFSMARFLSRWLIHLYLPRPFSNAPICPSVLVTTTPLPLRPTRNAFLCTRSKKK